jgi:hypothetical protein
MAGDSTRTADPGTLLSLSGPKPAGCMVSAPPFRPAEASAGSSHANINAPPHALRTSLPSWAQYTPVRTPPARTSNRSAMSERPWGRSTLSATAPRRISAGAGGRSGSASSTRRKLAVRRSDWHNRSSKRYSPVAGSVSIPRPAASRHTPDETPPGSCRYRNPLQVPPSEERRKMVSLVKDEPTPSSNARRVTSSRPSNDRTTAPRRNPPTQKPSHRSHADCTFPPLGPAPDRARGTASETTRAAAQANRPSENRPSERASILPA